MLLTTVFATFYQLSDAMMEVKLKISKSDGRALHHPRDKASTTWFYEEPVTFYNLLNAVIQSTREKTKTIQNEEKGLHKRTNRRAGLIALSEMKGKWLCCY